MADANIFRQADKRKTLTPTARAEIVRRYLAGERDIDLAREFGVSRSIPRQSTVRAGFKPRSRKRFLTLREDAFASITPDSAYWIGFLLADGCILIHRQRHYRNPYIRVGVAAEDAEHIRKFRDHTVVISGGRNAPKILAALYKDATVALDRKAAKAHAIFTAAGY